MFRLNKPLKEIEQKVASESEKKHKKKRPASAELASPVPVKKKLKIVLVDDDDDESNDDEGDVVLLAEVGCVYEEIPWYKQDISSCVFRRKIHGGSRDDFVKLELE